MTEIRNPDECWVAVESWYYHNGEQKTFVSTRMVKEQAESIQEAGYMNIFSPRQEHGIEQAMRIQCYIRRASPEEMQEISFNERRMIRRLSD